MISVITTNIFPGNKHIEMAIKCLSSQTYKDFEWVFLDGHYNQNKDFVDNMCQEYKIERYIHSPFCQANHVGRWFHWEIYNNALMLCNNDLFLRFGVYRWMHNKTIETIVNYANKGIYVDLPHNTVNFDDFYNYSVDEINNNLSIIDGEIRPYMECSAGMFSYTRNRMLEINGNDEASTLIAHHEDADLNARWSNVKGIYSAKIQNALLRFSHEKSPSNILSTLEEGNSLCCGKKGCLSIYPNSYHLNYNPPVENEKFEYDGFQWIKSPCCGVVSPIDADEYLTYLKQSGKTFGSVGVDNRVGRNILSLYNDIIKINNFEDKLNLLINSHTDQKYLNNNLKINKTYSEVELKIQFKNILKEYCNINNIEFIDIDMLSAKYLEDKKKDDTKDFDIKQYLLNTIKDIKDKDIFLFEILEEINNIKDLNIIFNIINFNNTFISMKHENYPAITKLYNPINWWDEYISNNNEIFSDADKSNYIMNLIPEDFKKYLRCFFCIKKR